MQCDEHIVLCGEYRAHGGHMMVQLHALGHKPAAFASSQLCELGLITFIDMSITISIISKLRHYTLEKNAHLIK